MAGQQICLKWNSFQTNIVTSFENLWEEEGLVDVTLASDGQCIRAHKVILSACSPFFRQVFQTNPCQHPVIILQDVHFSELESLLCFVYKGEVNIGQENLPALLKAAETLQIRGLSGASEQVKEKMAIPRKVQGAEGAEGAVAPPPSKRHKSCGPSPPATPTKDEEALLSAVAEAPPLALTTTTGTEGEGLPTPPLEAEGGAEEAGRGGEEEEEEEGGVEDGQRRRQEGGGIGGGEIGEEEDEDRPLAHLSLKMEPAEFEYPCDSNSLPLALTLTLPNSAEEMAALPSVMASARRISDCDATLMKGEETNGGNNGMQQRRRSRSRGVSSGGMGGSGARRKRRHCNNFIWRSAPATPLLPPVPLPTDNGDASQAGGDSGGEGEEGLSSLAPPAPVVAALGTSDHGTAEDDGDESDKGKKARQRVSDEETEAVGAGGGAPPPYSLLPHACLLPSPSILSAWARARTPEQLSCDLMRLLFSTEERLVCNVNGKMGKRRFDAHKVLLIREVVRHHYNECSGGGRAGGSGGEEGGDESGERTVTDFEERWKGCVTRIDTANRGLKRNLVLRGRKASFLV
ncbi:protein bric-a-brac 2-like [Ischnura elegans]|uniref:protein bric-a-brac 2-like n=1 Tax=Ischnura elegans TaxID=197161 RepID=UPI001ED8AB67|nr:protein bric-a-brac 2-like [Ischnura elegans]